MKLILSTLIAATLALGAVDAAFAAVGHPGVPGCTFNPHGCGGTIPGCQLLGTCRADLPRADLASLGDCAFSFLVPLHQSVKNPDNVRLRIAGTPIHLLPDANTRIERIDPGA